MIEKDLDDDRIMLKPFYREFLTQVMKLLHRYFEDPRITCKTPTMTKFMGYLDDFLLMGNSHKYNIMKKMRKMMEGVLEEYTKDKEIENV